MLRCMWPLITKPEDSAYKIALHFILDILIKKDIEKHFKEILTQEHDVSASSCRHHQMQIIKVLS